MRIAKLLSVLVLCLGILLSSGCKTVMSDLQIQNDAQRKRIAQLETELRTAELQLDQCKRQLASADDKGSVEAEALQKKIEALEEDLAKKKEMIASMQQKLLYGSEPLPVELTTKLEDFAQGSDMVEYDASRGIVKFKSDLLFDRGSDVVASSAIEAVKTLCEILNSTEAQRFDAIIAGHTDDIPVLRPATREKHPTNWHLSAHRAIAVLNVMTGNKVDSKRLSIRGFGEFRPIEANKPNKGGNAKNRRVEIFIVPQGV